MNLNDAQCARLMWAGCILGVALTAIGIGLSLFGGAPLETTFAFCLAAVYYCAAYYAAVRRHHLIVERLLYLAAQARRDEEKFGRNWIGSSVLIEAVGGE